MSNSDAEDFIAKIEANYRSNALVVPPMVPGGEIKERNGVITFFTNVPYAGGNGVISTKVNPADLDETIQQVQNYFRSKKVPMLWSVYPSDEPENLGAELERYGFVKVDEPAGMAVRLQDLSAEMSLVPGLEIVRVEDRETLLPGTKIIIEVFELPEFMIENFVEMSLQFIEKRPGQQIYYTALLEGSPVGTSMLFIDPDGIAGIYSVTTLESARRRGIGRALTLQALLDARNLGYDLAILGASEMGYRMYESLGFKEYCKIRFYFWQPEEVLPAPDSLTEK